MPTKKIASNEVEIGMFVSSLDRPWRETSFLFQGFLVRGQDEIASLAKQCQYVYVLVPDEEIELSSSLSTPAPPVAAPGTVGQVRYETTATAEEERKAADRFHEGVSELVGEIEHLAREKAELRVPRIRKSIDVMVASVQRNPDAYIWLTRIRKFDSYTYKHSLTASVLAATLGRHLGLPSDKLSELATGALLMDIGKTALPKALLHKKTRLTNEEWALMKTHVDHGLDTVSRTAGVTPGMISIVGTHHERQDGSGYPAGLKGSRIPFFGQIAGIIDFYVAVTTPRPFAQAISASNAIQMLHEQRGRYFNETLVQNFIHVLSTYPTGSLVELSTGEVGIVMSQNPGLRLRPNVILLLDPDKQPYGSYHILNLVEHAYQNEGNPINIKKMLPAGAYGLDVEELSL